MSFSPRLPRVAITDRMAVVIVDSPRASSSFNVCSLFFGVAVSTEDHRIPKIVSAAFNIGDDMIKRQLREILADHALLEAHI